MILNWYTPPEVFAALAFQFDLDPCSPGQDVVPWITATEHYTAADDGLSKDWHGSVWMNCPWNGDMSRWITKFIDHGNGVAMLPLLPLDSPRPSDPASPRAHLLCATYPGDHGSGDWSPRPEYPIEPSG